MKSMRRRIVGCLTLAWGLPLAAAGSAAVPPVPLGDAFPLNPGEVCSGAKPCSFDAPVVVGSPGGGILGAWVKHNDSSDGTLFARAYRSSGAAVQAAAQVSDALAVYAAVAGQPAAACDPAGDYLVTWGNRTQANGDVVLRRLSPQGAPVAPAVDLAPAPAGFDGGDTPSSFAYGILSRAPDGSFIVVWEDEGPTSGRLVGRHVDAFGAPLSDEFEIAAGLALGEQPSVTHYGTTGTFLVAWVLNHHLYARRYAPAATP